MTMVVAKTVGKIKWYNENEMLEMEKLFMVKKGLNFTFYIT